MSRVPGRGRVGLLDHYHGLLLWLSWLLLHCHHPRRCSTRRQCVNCWSSAGHQYRLLLLLLELLLLVATDLDRE